MRGLIYFLFFLSVIRLEAALTVTARGTSGDNTAGSSTTIVPASNKAVGSTGVLCLAIDNANGATANVPISATDSVGNIWYRKNIRLGSVANAQPENSLWYAKISTASQQATVLRLVS